MPKQVVIIGAVALGPKAACRFKRLEPDSRVVMIDQSDLISYGGCGIPYFVSGDVSDASQLQATSFHMIRDQKFFREAKDIEVLVNTKVLAIDRKSKKVSLKGMLDGKEHSLPYDKLVLAMGSRPRRLPVPGTSLSGVYAVSNLNEAIAIKDEMTGGKVEKAVVIGAGAIGLEMAQALADLWGIDTTVLDVQDQILPGVVSPNMAKMAQVRLEKEGIQFFLGEKVKSLEGNLRVEKVISEKGTFPADMVILAAGVTPNTDLARAAGLDISSSGGIAVNQRMQTSAPDIYAGGDCVSVTDLLTGQPGYFPSGSLANRQGRVIGTNLAGGQAVFEGAVGTFIIKLFDLSLASAGMSLAKALANGFDAISVSVVQFDRAHFYPEKDLMFLELVVEKGTKRVLGIQGLGSAGDGVLARVSAVAPLLKSKPVTEDISNLELPYSPPFSAAMDILNALGNTAENTLEGRNRVLDVDQFALWWDQRKDEQVLFLDCRGWGNAEPFVQKYPDCWKSIPQDELRLRMEEVPRDKPLVLVCNTGVRSYEAQLLLRQKGVNDTYNLQGGVAALKEWGLDV